MDIDRKMDVNEAKGAELRHGPVDRRPFVHMDDAGPRRAVERAHPHKAPITLPLATKGEGFSETA